MRDRGTSSVAAASIAEIAARIIGGPEALARVARLVAPEEGPERLLRSTARAWRAEGGLSSGQARRLEAALELARRVAAPPRVERPRFSNGRGVFELVGPELSRLEQEVFEVLLLDARNGLLRRERVSMGTLTGSIVHPREVFRQAVREVAAAVVLVHNHPSGDPSPSAEDIEVTERLAAAGELLGIRVLDHVVVGDGVYVSFAERGLIGRTGPARVAEGGPGGQEVR